MLHEGDTIPGFPSVDVFVYLSNTNEWVDPKNITYCWHDIMYLIIPAIWL
jgi:hypothetical protein